MIQVVVGIIKKDNKILIGQRPVGKPYSGYWEFPGGKIEANEANKDALIRELQEELGILVTSACSFFTCTHQYPDKQVLLDFWLVTDFLGNPIAKENQLLRWATFAEMVDLKLLAANFAIIPKIKKLLD